MQAEAGDSLGGRDTITFCYSFSNLCIAALTTTLNPVSEPEALSHDAQPGIRAAALGLPWVFL